MLEPTSESSPRFGPSSADRGRQAQEQPHQGIDLAFDGGEDLFRAWRDGLTPDPESHRLGLGRSSPGAEPARRQRSGAVADVADAVPARDHGCAVAVPSGAAHRGDEGRPDRRHRVGKQLDRLRHPPRAGADAGGAADGGAGETVLAAAHRSADRGKPGALREKVAPARSRDSGNTVLSKEFPGGILVMTGANSAVGLRSMPVRYLFLDEVDAYPPSADEEGEPVALAEARTRTFSWRRKAFLASTPTIKGLSRIEREFEASDQRRYFLPCPHCGERQWLRFERLRWEKGRPETVAYWCEGCERPIAEHHKTRMLAEGEWRPTADIGRSADHRFSSLGPLFAGGLAFVGADRPRMGGGAGDPTRPNAASSTACSARPGSKPRRGAGLAAAL